MIIGIFAAAPFTVSASDNVAYYISKLGVKEYYSDFWAAWNMAELKNNLARKNIDGKSDSTMFWISGYSRAGATANLSAKRIVDT